MKYVINFRNRSKRILFSWERDLPSLRAAISQAENRRVKGAVDYTIWEEGKLIRL